MIRVVIDTNVIISGLISGKSPPGIIIDSWISREFIPVLSESMIEEINLTLQKPKIKKIFNAAVSKNIFNHLQTKADIVKIKEYFEVCQDPDDNILFNAAMAGQADLIVSRDKKVLEVTDFKNVQTVTLAWFVVNIIRDLTYSHD